MPLAAMLQRITRVVLLGSDAVMRLPRPSWASVDSFNDDLM